MTEHAVIFLRPAEIIFHSYVVNVTPHSDVFGWEVSAVKHALYLRGEDAVSSFSSDSSFSIPPILIIGRRSFIFFSVCVKYHSHGIISNHKSPRCCCACAWRRTKFGTHPPSSTTVQARLKQARACRCSTYCQLAACCVLHGAHLHSDKYCVFKI